tara:strand:+ start:253 stop:567 length:315 start_codon:yes stop_codon:yes gene_type:complete
MFKKILLIITIILFASSCANTWDSVKRGLTGGKSRSADEFLVKKKDPLILPPDFENLPSPSDRQEAEEELSSFKKTLSKSSLIETDSSTASSAEESILQKIKKK